MRKGLRNVKIAAAVLVAGAIGLILANAVAADAETDEQLQKIDGFIEMQEDNLAKTLQNIANEETETVSLSYADWKAQDLREDATFTGADNYQAELDSGFVELITGDSMTPEDFRQAGVIFRDGWKYTWYSEKVLPGEGLQIPGRWSDGNFVRDHEGFLCVACNDLPQGTEVETPFGMARVYDWVGDDVHGLIDIYVSW